jgi:MFS family permease
VNLVVVISAVGMPVRPLLGWAADRHIGALPTLIVASAVLGVVLFCWIPVRNVGGLYGWSVVYGLATGATQGIFVGALASLTKEANKMGTRFGMVCSVLAFASLAGPPTAGALIQSDGGGFLRAQIWSGTVTVAGAGLIGAAWWFSVRKERLAAGVPMMQFELPRRKQPETVIRRGQGDQISDMESADIHSRRRPSVRMVHESR